MDLDVLKAELHRDGFVVIRNFVSDEILSEIRERMPEALRRARKTDKKPRTKTETRSLAFTNVNKGLERMDPYFLRFLEEGPQIPILEHLLGEPPTPTTASYFSKDDPEEVVQPHRDGDNGATIWIALDPCGPDNGCVYFLRGSHLSENVGGNFNLGSVDDLMAHPDAVPAELNPGDVSIHLSKTVHWSGKNNSGAPRRGLNAFYQKIDGKRWFSKR